LEPEAEEPEGLVQEPEESAQEAEELEPEAEESVPVAAGLALAAEEPEKPEPEWAAPQGVMNRTQQMSVPQELQ